MKKHHILENIHFSDDSLVLTIDGEEKAFKLSDISQNLLNASYLERRCFDVSPSGYGIHWPLLDEDLSIDGLLRITHAPDQVGQSA